MAAGDTIRGPTLSTGVNNAQGVVSGAATLDVPTADVNAKHSYCWFWKYHSCKRPSLR